MAKNFKEQVAVRLTGEMYSALLQEAGSPRGIAELIREKLEASYLSRDDAKLLRAQQSVILKILADLLIDMAPVAVRMKRNLQKQPETDRQAEADETRKRIESGLEKIQGYLKEEGVLRW